MIEGQPHERILKFLAPGIEGEGLHHPDIANGKLFEHDPSVADRREIVGGGPILGAILNAPINDVRPERFKCGGRIAEIFVVQLVKIIEADIDVKATAPMIFDALVDDMAESCGLYLLNTSNEKITSSGVTGVPSFHFACPLKR